MVGSLPSDIADFLGVQVCSGMVGSGVVRKFRLAQGFPNWVPQSAF